ncbi:MAG: DNA polymerase [Acinetobacter sp.]
MTEYIDIAVLDIETRSKKFEMREHAGLEPWRVRHGTAEILSVDVYFPGGKCVQLVNRDDGFNDRLINLLKSLEGKIVFAHNAIFDVAWLIATLQPKRCGDVPTYIKNIQWRDSMLLFKWLINGQLAEGIRFSYSLPNLVKKFLADHPDTPDFVKMKAEAGIAGEDVEYWLERGTLDVKMTYELIAKVYHKVPRDMRVGMMTEFECIWPVANSWINGFRIDIKQLEANDVKYSNLKFEIAKELKTDAGLFSSPKRLGHFLFTELDLTPHGHTPSGSPGTSKGDLMWIEYALKQRGDPKALIVRKILEAKEASTLYSKYVKTMKEALAHTGDGYIYSSPRLFGTYTGRMTYSNTVTHKDPDKETKTKYKTSIAMHQIPRKAKDIRASMMPPEGHDILEFDAAGQESRLMALQSKDQTLLDIFTKGLNFHSMTGASIIGMDYDDFEDIRNKEKDDGPMTEARQRGKLTNLACNFRISGKALAKQAFEKYDVMIDVSTGNHLVKTFTSSYDGIPDYWKRSIYDAKTNGFAETYGGRRFKVQNWQQERWQTESSAIMVPIQGSGASMKEIAISQLARQFPEFHFALDLHDASFGYVLSDQAKRIFSEMEEFLNTIDYEPFWGFKPSIALPYDGKMGSTFADVK